MVTRLANKLDYILIY